MGKTDRITELEHQLAEYKNANLIEHKYNINDVVYYIDNNEIYKDTIKRVMVFKDKESNVEQYRLEKRAYPSGAINSTPWQYLFASPEELFEELIKNLEK